MVADTARHSSTPSVSTLGLRQRRAGKIRNNNRLIIKNDIIVQNNCASRLYCLCSALVVCVFLLLDFRLLDGLLRTLTRIEEQYVCSFGSELLVLCDDVSSSFHPIRFPFSSMDFHRSVRLFRLIKIYRSQMMTQFVHLLHETTLNASQR